MTNLKIPFVDLKKINLKYKKKFLNFLSSAIEDSNYIKGKKTEELEKKFVKFFNVKMH